MKQAPYLLLFISGLIFADVPEISEQEAWDQVVGIEQQKASNLAAKQARLKSDQITTSAVVHAGVTRVTFNQVEPKMQQTELQSQVLLHPSLPPVSRITEPPKESLSLIISGVVYDEQISELWWKFEDQTYRAFVNANFHDFPGIIQFEDEALKYSVVALLGARRADELDITGEAEKWIPSKADFTDGVLEYFLVSPETDEDSQALVGFNALLRYYDSHSDELITARKNADKLKAAKKAYLAENPPQKEDLIINFWPTDGKKDSENRYSLDTAGE